MNLSRYVGTLNLLGDESRLRLCALLDGRELSVTDLVRVTGISQSRVSTHLARLREGGFVRDRRDGQHAFYALATDTLPETAKAVLEGATRAADPTLEGDQRRPSELEAARRGQLPTRSPVRWIAITRRGAPGNRSPSASPRSSAWGTCSYVARATAPSPVTSRRTADRSPAST